LYIRNEFGFCKPDILTTAGGSRTVSFFKAEKGKERLNFEIKNSSFYIDFKAYLSHNSDTVIIVDHEDCGFWPKYSDGNEERYDHAKSLKVAETMIKENYSQIKKIILLYAELDKNRNKIIGISEIHWHQHELVFLNK
jgi:hypothetical protein